MLASPPPLIASYLPTKTTVMEVDSTNIHSHPHPHHRKIELQSTLDLSYLRTNLATAARQRLDLHFPPSHSQPSPLVINLDGAGDSKEQGQTTGNQEQREEEEREQEEDPMRARVVALVRDFIDQTFSAAHHSISINGLDASASSPQLDTQPQIGEKKLLNKEEEEERIEYEPYDPRLTAKVAQLYAETERQSALVAGLRRRAPREGAELMARELAGTVALEAGAVDAAEMEIDGDEVKVEGLDLRPFGAETGHGGGDADAREWQAEIERMYERGLGELAALAGLNGQGQGGGGGKKSLTETVGRVQRAGVVAREFE